MVISVEREKESWTERGREKDLAEEWREREGKQIHEEFSSR